MQLQTEENQKVGRLFEDTKYTGLIAKLKRDGVPSYQGSQLTVTISTPAIGTAVPVPVAGTAGTVSPAYYQGAPSAPGHGAPSVSRKGAPSAAGQGFPSVPGGSIAAGQGIPSPTPIAAAVAPAVTPAAVAAKKDVVKAVTYEWAPPGVNQTLVRILPHLRLVM